MTPTPEQIQACRDAASSHFGGDAYEKAYLAKWEEVRPKEDASQLQRTNHALAAELAAVKTELNDRLHERTQAFLAKELALIRQRDALNEQLLDAKYKISMHEAHSKNWSPLVSFIQGSKYGTIGECCFAVALRQLKAFEAELAGIKADCRLAESHYERAERSLQESQSELAALGAQYHARGDELKEARRLIANLQDLLERGPLPRWKPVVEPISGPVLIRQTAFETLTLASGVRPEPGYFYLLRDELMALPMEAAPKPTAEELEANEFMAAMLTKYPEFDGATDFAEGALVGWKAARSAKGGSEA